MKTCFQRYGVCTPDNKHATPDAGNVFLLSASNRTESGDGSRAMKEPGATGKASLLQAEKGGKILLCQGTFFEIIWRTCGKSGRCPSLRRRIPLFVLLALCLPCRLMAWSGQ